MKEGIFLKEVEQELTESEIVVKAKCLADQLKKLADSEQDAKDAAERFKNDQKMLKAQIARSRDIIATGKEERPVHCQHIRNDTRSTIETMRIDTGEILETRPMTADERQTTMPFAVKDGGKGGKGGRKAAATALGNDEEESASNG
jgi:hypothetical protein